MSMGNWKIKQYTKKSRGSRTKSSKAKLYFAVPPAEGWPAFTGTNWSALSLRNRVK